jgi:hypothetical protein
MRSHSSRPRLTWRKVLALAGPLLALATPGPAAGHAAPAEGASAAGEASSRQTTIEGSVAAGDGRLVPGVWVLALPAEGGAVSAAAPTDARGRFRLVVPGRRHHLGMVSPGWQLARMSRTPTGLLQLQVRPVFASREELQTALARSAGGAAWQAIGLPPSGAFALVRGRVFDAAGSPLPGVRVIVTDARGRATGATFSNQAGEYTILVPAGEIQVQVVAGGFKVRDSTPTTTGPDFVLEIDAAMETIAVSTGHVLRFRISDSSWPEYVPPPAVAAWLRFAYGIDLDADCPKRALPVDDRPGTRISPTAVGGTAGRGPSPFSCPRSVAVRGKQKWWWLRLLESPPPNPARLASWGDEAEAGN